MLTAILVNTIIDGLPYMSLPKHPGKTDHAIICDTYYLLMKNSASMEFPLIGDQNGYLYFVPMDA